MTAPPPDRWMEEARALYGVTDVDTIAAALRREYERGREEFAGQVAKYVRDELDGCAEFVGNEIRALARGDK